MSNLSKTEQFSSSRIFHRTKILLFSENRYLCHVFFAQQKPYTVFYVLKTTKLRPKTKGQKTIEAAPSQNEQRVLSHESKSI